MTPRRVPLLAGVLVPALALVVGIAAGAVGLHGYRSLTGPPAPDVPRYRLPGSWDLCAHVSRAPLAYLGATETGAGPNPALVGGAYGKTCNVDFGTADDTSSAALAVGVAVLDDETVAHELFTTVEDGSFSNVDLPRSAVAVERVSGLGSEANLQYARHPAAGDAARPDCSARSDRLVVRHGILVFAVDVAQCRPGTPPDETALRGAEYGIAVELMHAVPRD